MHNCFLFILSWICCLQLFISNDCKTKMTTSTLLINEYLIEDCLNLDSLLESGEMGFHAIELDKEKIKKYVKTTLTQSFPQFEFSLFYYFYDSKSLKSCAIASVPCNSIQIKIIILYQNLKTEKILRYELKERK